MRTKNIIIYLLIAILLAVAFIPGVKSFVQDKLFPVKMATEATKLPEIAFDVELKGINVPDTKLSQLKGQKPIFLNFWGTWCAPCREEWPSVQKLYDLKKDKIQFVLIAMMDKEEQVQKFMKENNYTVPVYIATSPIDNSILPKSFPTTFVLGKDGEIIVKETATKDWSSDNSLFIINKLAP